MSSKLYQISYIFYYLSYIFFRYLICKYDSLYMNKISRFPNNLTDIDVKTCFDVKTVSLNEKQIARVFAVNMNERQSTTEMIQVHWIQIDLKWTR